MSHLPQHSTYTQGKRNRPGLGLSLYTKVYIGLQLTTDSTPSPNQHVHPNNKPARLLRAQPPRQPAHSGAAGLSACAGGVGVVRQLLGADLRGCEGGVRDRVEGRQSGAGCRVEGCQSGVGCRVEATKLTNHPKLLSTVSENPSKSELAKNPFKLLSALYSFDAFQE